MGGFAAAALLVLWFAYRRAFVPRRIMAVSTVAAVVMALWLTPILYSYLASRPDNLTVRFQQYEGAFRMLAANPVLGVGLNNSPGVQKSYSDAGSSAPLDDPTKTTHTNPIHSYPLGLAAEVGVVGFLLYAGFFACVLVEAWRLSRSGNRDIALFATFLVLSITALAASVAGDPLYEDALLVLLWFESGAVFALSRMERSRVVSAVSGRA
jgi:O-antigen ligase